MATVRIVDVWPDEFARPGNPYLQQQAQVGEHGTLATGETGTVLEIVELDTRYIPTLPAYQYRIRLDSPRYIGRRSPRPE